MADPQPAGSPVFATTHWSLVVSAGHSAAPGAQQALDKLCRTYWYPLYAYVRRRGHSVEDAQDLTQAFFARLLEKGHLALADRERGRFRTFLLTALQRFLIDGWRREQSERRSIGGARLWNEAEAESRYLAEPTTHLTPEKIYERRWAMQLLEQVMTRLGDEAVQAGKMDLFEGLKALLWGDKEAASYAELSERLGLSEGALRVAAHRLRQRYRELLRDEIAQTVEQTADIDEELRYLQQVLE